MLRPAANYNTTAYYQRLKIEAAVVKGLRSNTFKWLFSRSRDLVSKLVLEKSLKDIDGSLLVTEIQL